MPIAQNSGRSHAAGGARHAYAGAAHAAHFFVCAAERGRARWSPPPGPAAPPAAAPLLRAAAARGWRHVSSALFDARGRDHVGSLAALNKTEVDCAHFCVFPGALSALGLALAKAVNDADRAAHARSRNRSRAPGRGPRDHLLGADAAPPPTRRRARPWQYALVIPSLVVVLGVSCAIGMPTEKSAATDDDRRSRPPPPETSAPR